MVMAMLWLRNQRNLIWIELIPSKNRKGITHGRMSDNLVEISCLEGNLLNAGMCFDNHRTYIASSVLNL
jgi:hypothetical protein